MHTFAQAHILATAIHTILADTDAADTHVTIDAMEVSAHAQTGAILIQVEKVVFPHWTPSEPEAEFQVHVIAGPPDRPLVAWQRMDKIIAALHQGGLNIARATPSTFAPGTGPALPAFTLDLNPLD